MQTTVTSHFSCCHSSLYPQNISRIPSLLRPSPSTTLFKPLSYEQDYCHLGPFSSPLPVYSQHSSQRAFWNMLDHITLFKLLWWFLRLLRPCRVLPLLVFCFPSDLIPYHSHSCSTFSNHSPLLPIVVLQVCSCGLKALAFSIPPSKRVLPHLSPSLLYSNVIFLSEDFPNTLYRNNTLSPQLSLSPFALFIFSVTFSTTWHIVINLFINKWIVCPPPRT